MFSAWQRNTLEPTTAPLRRSSPKRKGRPNNDAPKKQFAPPRTHGVSAAGVSGRPAAVASPSSARESRAQERIDRAADGEARRTTDRHVRDRQDRSIG